MLLDLTLDPLPRVRRRALIAELVSDFIKPTTPENVRLLLRERYRRRGRTLPSLSPSG